ncbi:MAG: glycosyltransferase [Gammaproteobacteria bacterium]
MQKPPSPQISVIVPLAQGDETWRELLPRLPENGESLFAANAPPPPDWMEKPGRRWIQCAKSGRGAQMNTAAEAANGEFLWFVHADTRLPENAAAVLQKSLAAEPRAVHYFDLRFYDGGRRMFFNEIGARLRCAFFGNPFGDQALCLPRAAFMELGGYSENTAPGEDHIFVLRAARAGLRARRVGAAAGTSARTYLKRGWWRTVLEYQKIWLRQWRER